MLNTSSSKATTKTVSGATFGHTLRSLLVLIWFSCRVAWALTASGILTSRTHAGYTTVHYISYTATLYPNTPRIRRSKCWNTTVAVVSLATPIVSAPTTETISGASTDGGKTDASAAQITSSTITGLIGSKDSPSLPSSETSSSLLLCQSSTVDSSMAGSSMLLNPEPDPNPEPEQHPEPESNSEPTPPEPTPVV